MNYKGDYAAASSYSAGDVVIYTDGIAYMAFQAAAAGITPHEESCWERLKQPLQEVVVMFSEMLKDLNDGLVELEDDLTQTTAGKKALDAHQGAVLKGMIPANISDDAIVLKDASENEYLITVDASGESPELVVTAVEAEAAGGES